MNNEDVKKNETFIEENSKIYTEILEIFSGGFFNHDIEHGEMLLTPAWKKRLRLENLSPKETAAVGRTLIHPDDIEKVKNIYEKAFAEHSLGIMFEFRTKTADSGYIWVHSKVKVTYNPEGKPEKCYGVYIDISEPKKIEEKLAFQAEALRESEEKYRELVEHSPAGIYEIDFRTMRFKSVNDAMCMISGYSREELLNMTPFDVMDEESRLKFRRRVRRWLSGAEPEKNVDYKFIIKDGRELYGELDVKFTRDENGNPLGCTGIIHDVTERRKMEDELKQSESLLRSIIEGTNDPIYLKDSRSRPILINSAVESVLGIPAEKIIGKLCDEYIDDKEIAKQLVDNDSMVMDSDAAMCFEEILPDGRTYYSTKSPWHDADGNVIGTIGVSRDFTKRKAMESRLVFQAGLLTSVHDAIIALDKDYKVTYWNSMAESLTGWKSEEVMGMSAKEFFPNIVLALDWNEVKGIFDKEGLLTGEFEARKKDGTRFVADARVQAIKGAKNEKAGLVASFRDITQRIQNEAEIGRQNNILQIIKKVYEKSVTCTTEQQLGQECLEIVNSSVGGSVSFIGEVGEDGDLYSIAFSNSFDTHNIPGTESRRKINGPRMARVYETVIKSGRSLLENDPSGYCTGTSLPAGHFEFTSFLWAPFVQSGKVLGIIGVANKEGGFSEEDKQTLEAVTPSILEVLMRKHAEEALHKAFLREEIVGQLARRLLEGEGIQTIMEDICGKPGGFAGCDVFFNYLCEEGRLRLNAYAGIPDKEVEKIRSLGFGEAVCGCAARDGKSIIINCVQSSTDERVNFLKSLGIKRYASFPLISDGLVIGTLAFGCRNKDTFTEDELTFMNIVSGHIAIAINRLIISGELKDSEMKARSLVMELEEADRNKNQFLSALSHELRNPLGTISAGLHILNVTQDKGMYDNAVNIMNRQMKHLCRLVDDLLDLTRISHNKIVLKKERIDLKETVRMAGEDSNLYFREKGITLKMHIYGEALFIEADPDRITQAVGNLLHNASKYTEAGSNVTLSVYREGDEAVISVADNGLGIDTDFLPDVFKPFAQADTSLDRKKGGLGLGLSIVRSIAELHGGSASVKSKGRGHGAVFTIRLPFGPAPKEEEKQSETVKIGGSAKVLIIEDQNDFAVLLRDLLSEIGYAAEISRDGKDGLSKAKKIAPDVILCDIGLPGLSGYEVARRVRQDSRLSGTYLVALTGYAGAHYEEEAGKAGFDRHISKPVDAETLKTLLSEFSQKSS